MIRNTALFAGLCFLASCTVHVTPQAVFNPPANHPQNDPSKLLIDGEGRVASRVQLQHSILESDAGPIAVTLARTGSQKLILHCMGNNADRFNDGVAYLNGLTPFADALIFDYPGFGDSPGEATTANFDLALETLAATLDGSGYSNYEEVYVWGHSLGGFVCAQLVPKVTRRIDGVIFETTASDVETLSEYWEPWYLKPFLNVKIDPLLLEYDSVEAVRGFGGKVLVLSAGKDKDLPPALTMDLTEKLRKAGLDSRLIEFEEAGHDDIAAQPDYVARVSDFFSND